MTEYTLHTFINDLKQEDNNTGQARLEDFHHAGDGPDGPDGPLWMLPADCGNRRAEVVVSLLRTGPVEMGDNKRLMLPGVVRGWGWGSVPHSYASLQIFTLPIKPQCSLFILFWREIEI